MIDFLTPVSKEVLAHAQMQEEQALGFQVQFHTETEFPKIEKGNLVLFGVLENRNDINYTGNQLSFNNIRKSLYELYPGNWTKTIIDIGDILQGASVADTYFAIKKVISSIIKLGATPITIGGSNDLTYAQYRAYDNLDQMVNLVTIDAKFDLKNPSEGIKNNNYLNHIITEEPTNLSNYTNIGFQTYYNSQEEIDLMEQLYFEAYRLGEISSNLNNIEPITRNADAISFDLTAIRAAELCYGKGYRSPNGFNGKEACAIARYAGISNKVSSFSILEINHNLSEAGTMLVAQIIWYFIEGMHCKIQEPDFAQEKYFTKYNVLLPDLNLVFYKSQKSKRWWVQNPENNISLKNTLLPCSEEDYNAACKQQIPERIFKAFRKNLI